MAGRAGGLYDPFSYRVQLDPYPTYRILRDKFPAYHNEERGFWALSRYDDIQAATSDWQTFSNEAGVSIDGTGQLFGPGNFLDSDPPRHDDLRAVIRGTFTPKNIQRLEGRVRAKVTELIDAFVNCESADLAEEFAWALPVSVISELLGFPREDQKVREGWARTVLIREPDDNQLPSAAVETLTTMRSYFTDTMKARRQAVGEDLLSDIVSAEVNGKRLTEAEIVGMTFLLFVAGTETTASLLGNSLLLLEQHADQRAELIKNPSNIPKAIEELLRYESPIQNLARVTTRDVELHGGTISEGSRVLLLYASANRDDRRFHNPDCLDLKREPKRNMAFGNGIHFCLGAPLARLETRIALEEILSRVPNYRVDGLVERLHTHESRPLARLPVALAPR